MTSAIQSQPVAHGPPARLSIARVLNSESEYQLQSQLHDTLTVTGRGNHAEHWNSRIDSRPGKNRTVKRVKELSSERKAHGFSNRYRERAEDGQVEIMRAVGTKDIPSGISECELRRNGE